MENKKTTILLVVIAIATLLVAVVGATFAFFGASVDADNDNVTITTTTAKANDVFLATTEDDLELEVTNDKMLQSNGKDDHTVIAATDTAGLTVSLEAGSGKASCQYYIKYTDASTIAYEATASAALPEYSIQGSAGSLSIAETNMDAIPAAGFGPFTIEDSYEEASAATEQEWTLTGNFYNLGIEQGKHLNKVYTGTFSVTGVTCTNSAN